MKTRNTLFILGLLVLFPISSILGQTIKLRKATREYRDFAYVKTSDILLEVANKGYRSVDLLQKLASSYYFYNNMEAAAQWYGELFALAEDGSNSSIDPESYFRYAQSLKSIQRYEEANEWMRKFSALKTDDLRGKAFLNNVDYVSDIESINNSITLENLSINTALSDFGGALENGQFIFASTRGGGRLYDWNAQPYLDLYTAERQSDGTYGNPQPLNDKINTRYHESSVSFTPDQNTMYFTRNNYYKHSRQDSDQGITMLQLYRATLNEAGKWDAIKPLPFNNDSYSTAHPSVNASGTRLYFSSDMPGSTGESDIYMVSIKEDGSLGNPMNLGREVNTEGLESFPFINSKGDLYFSSNGHPNLGGLDVFVIRDFESKMLNNEVLKVENLGRPYNSSLDDFSYSELLAGEQGFISSNRLGGKGDDDIYSFVKCLQDVNGVVLNKVTGEPLAGSTVTLSDGQGNLISEKVVGEDAKFSFTTDCNKEYLIRGTKEGFIGDEERFTTPVKKQPLDLVLELQPDEQPVEPGDDLGPILDIPIIHFDFDKSNIRPDAEIELQKVIAVLNQYPNMKIDVRSHTDSRGSMSYNDALSTRRNISTIKYLVEVGGIDPSRLTGKGYGERRLVNHCSDGVVCTEAEHQANRRSEFIVVENNTTD